MCSFNSVFHIVTYPVIFRRIRPTFVSNSLDSFGQWRYLEICSYELIVVYSWLLQLFCVDAVSRATLWGQTLGKLVV